ncbi:MAG: DUF4259 domain-containing protein [Alphaproteobacteria bacterium]|jgi:hypothetical protein|nr:DUF4259 domain-containing protein [Alphaproteobacteria bacterium]
MGAWGSESFENDDALDWVNDLEASEGTAVIKLTLQAVIDESDYLEAPECSAALAAAEVVAALKGAPGKGLPEEVLKWIAGNATTPDRSLIEKTLAAVTRIKTDSELLGLWEDEGDPGDWRAGVEDLESRLQ